MMNENNEKGLRKPAEGAGSAVPRKKVSVVFRSQNSQSMKELPKGLKAAGSVQRPSAKPAVRKPAGTAEPVQRTPRPLPAGTKPVRPALLGNRKEESPAAAAAPKPQAAVPAPEAPVKETAAVQNIVEKPQEAPVPAAKAETPAVQTPETAPVSAAAESAETKAPAAGVSSAPQKAAAGSEAEPEAAAARKKSAEAARPAAARPAAPAEKPAEKAPGIKIIKSYANYDAAAVIAEASKNARSGYQRPRTQSGSGERPPYRGQRDGGAAGTDRRPVREGQGGGRRIVISGQAAGESRNFGQRSGAGAGTGRPQSGARPQGRPQGGGFEAPQGKNMAGRKNSFAASKDRREKKDKYRDEMVPQKQPRTGKGAFIKPEPKKEKPEDDIKVIVIPETLTIKELSDKLRFQPSVIIKKLFMQGRIVNPNTELSYEEAEEIAMEYDILCEKEVQEDVIASLLSEDEEDESKLVPRSPVVCVMGHVDHGKTSLLDAIRNTAVTSHEAGGITQHIGASVVKQNGRTITFLDTPGHEAFTAMRLRGAQATDIAVLVVAADDGVKPQTIEAISHARSAGVEIVVAINKIDKPGANIDRVKKELAEQELLSEEWGGTTPMVPVSAKTGEGIPDLLEMILLEADVMELKANPYRNARGIVIEARLDKGRGPVATVLIQKGTLNVGDNAASGACYGKVRAMIDDKGNRIRKAGPSTPVEILGLNDVPNAGEVFMVCDDEKTARSIAETFIAEHRKHMVEETRQKMNLDDLFDEIKAGKLKELPIIVKADVQGSVEAVKQSLGKLSNEEVVVKVIHSGVGNISESDVTLASAADAIIIGFNVKPDATAKSIAEHEHVDIRLYKVIYQAIEDLEAALTGMLAPVYEEKNTGKAIIRQLFKASGVGTIAGCYVTDGVVERGSRARIFRNEKQVFDGSIASLKRFKDEVKEVKTGFECGMVFEGFSEVEVDDNVEIYKMVQVPRTQKKAD